MLRLNVRLPKGLLRKLKQHVKGDSIPLSLQQEIVRRLERSFEDVGPSPATMAAIQAAAEAAARAAADEVMEKLKGADKPPVMTSIEKSSCVLDLLDSDFTFHRKL